MRVRLKLNRGLSISLGPNFKLSTDFGTISPIYTTKDQLLNGIEATLSEYDASKIKVSSIGTCEGFIEFSISKDPNNSFVILNPTSTPTPTPTLTPVPTRTPTSTPTSTPTGTPTGTLTNTPTSTPTSTPTGTLTNTPTSTPTGTPTNTPTSTPTGTPTNTPTRTPTPTPTGTPTNTPTSTPTGTPTNTPTRTPTPTPTAIIPNCSCSDLGWANGTASGLCYGDCTGQSGNTNGKPFTCRKYFTCSNGGIIYCAICASPDSYFFPPNATCTCG